MVGSQKDLFKRSIKRERGVNIHGKQSIRENEILSQTGKRGRGRLKPRASSE